MRHGQLAWLLFASRWHSGPAIIDPNEEEKRLAWKYPTCAHLATQGFRKVDWLAFRENLHRHPYPENMGAVVEVLENLTGSSAEYDAEARVCIMGVPATFFFLTKYTLETMDRDDEGWPDPEMLRKATLQYSVLENYISALHPGLIDLSNWSFTDAEVMMLRKQILKNYQQSAVREQAARDAEAAAVATGAAAAAADGPAVPARQPGAAAEPPLRVYVYDEAEVPGLSKLLQGQIYCSRGQWGTDVQFHDFFLTSPYLTHEPEQADFFFVPGYAICVLEGNIYTLDQIDEIYKEVVQALPYFNASGGRDHIFVFGSGMAQSVFQSWKDYIPQAIVLTPETELFNDFPWVIEPPFQTWKDIAIPGSLDLTEVLGLIAQDRPLAARRQLAAFFGRVDLVRGPHPWVGGVDVRREILKLRELPGTEDLRFGDGATHEVMHAAYGDARFCFVPRGKSGWSLRLFEVMFAGCVPVIISDKWELPFEDFLDVTRFVIKWPSTQVGPQLLSYLRSLPNTTVQRYMDEVRRVRCWYFYPPRKLDVRWHLQRQHGVCAEQNRQDAFRGVLRQLLAKRRRTRSSPKTFFFRDASGRLLRTDADLRPLPR